MSSTKLHPMNPCDNCEAKGLLEEAGTIDRNDFRLAVRRIGSMATPALAKNSPNSVDMIYETTIHFYPDISEELLPGLRACAEEHALGNCNQASIESVDVIP